MLYAFKQNITPDSYIARRKETEDNTGYAYEYTAFLSSAMIFNSVPNAISWLEHTAYRNGQLRIFYNGHLRLIRVESVPVVPAPLQFREIGLVE